MLDSAFDSVKPVEETLLPRFLLIVMLSCGVSFGSGYAPHAQPKPDQVD